MKFQVRSITVGTGANPEGPVLDLLQFGQGMLQGPYAKQATIGQSGHNKGFGLNLDSYWSIYKPPNFGKGEEEVVAGSHCSINMGLERQQAVKNDTKVIIDIAFDKYDMSWQLQDWRKVYRKIILLLVCLKQLLIILQFTFFSQNPIIAVKFS